jgi:hypothetical protein
LGQCTRNGALAWLLIVFADLDAEQLADRFDLEPARDNQTQ